MRNFNKIMVTKKCGKKKTIHGMSDGRMYD